MKKKIVFHVNSLGKGGAERVVSVLAKSFAMDGCDVTIFTLWRAKEEYELDRSVKRVNLEDLWKDQTLGRLTKAVKRMTDYRSFLKKEQPDIVISFCNKANFRSAYSMLGMKIPLLVSVRNDPKRDYLPYPINKWWMEQKASGCVFQTPEAQSAFSKRLKERSKIIWNPVDEKYLIENKRENIDRDLVMVGRFSKQKNHILAVKAFAKIKDRYPDTCIRFYGEECDEGSQKELLDAIRENGLINRVKFMGPSSHLESDIKNAGVFVLASDYEGMPNALIEAMVMGLPVISTDCPCGGPSLLITPGENGLLVSVGDEEQMAKAMDRLLGDLSYAEALGRNAKKLREKVSTDTICETWKTYIAELTK